MAENPWKDPAAVAWSKHIIEDVYPALEDSAMFLNLTEGGLVDVDRIQYFTELGAAIYLGKPVLTVVLGTASISEKLRAVSDEVVVLPDGVNPEASGAFKDALARMRPIIDAEHEKGDS